MRECERGAGSADRAPAPAQAKTRLSGRDRHRHNGKDVTRHSREAITRHSEEDISKHSGESTLPRRTRGGAILLCVLLLLSLRYENLMSFFLLEIFVYKCVL